MGIFTEKDRIAILSDLMLLLHANPGKQHNRILSELKECLDICDQPDLERLLVAILAKYFRLDKISSIDKENSADKFCLKLIKELILRYKTERINTILTRILNKEELSHDLESYFNDDTNQRDFLFAASQFNLEEQQKIIRALFLTSPDYIGVVDYAQRNRLTLVYIAQISLFSRGSKHVGKL